MTRKNKVLDFKTVQDEILSSTRKVWLAGLGVLATVEEEGQNLFAEFVEKGKKVEARGKKNWARTRKEIESTTEEVSGRLDKLGSKVDENISEVLQRMGVPSRAQVQELTDRVGKLTDQVERLSTQKKAPARTAAKKPAAKTRAA